MIIPSPKNSMNPPGGGDGADASATLDHEQSQTITQSKETPSSVAGMDTDFAKHLSEFIAKYKPALKSLAEI